MSVMQVDKVANRKKIDRIEAKAGDILLTLVDGQVLRFFADKGTGKVEVEIVEPHTPASQGQPTK